MRKADGVGLSGDQLFKQEYPLTITEAFQSGAGNVFDASIIELNSVIYVGGLFNKKQDGSWTTTKNRRETNVDSEQISTALDKFSNLSALTILSGQGYDDFMSNKNKVTLKFENDNKNIILNLLVVETGVSYLVKPSDENVMVVYEVSTETMDALFGFTK